MSKQPDNPTPDAQAPAPVKVSSLDELAKHLAQHGAGNALQALVRKCRDPRHAIQRLASRGYVELAKVARSHAGVD